MTGCNLSVLFPLCMIYVIKYRLLTRNEDAIGLSPRRLKANFILRKSQNAEELREKFTISSNYFHLNF